MNLCRITKRHISAYLDGELGEQRANQIKKHLAVCRKCAKVAQDYQQTYNLIRQPALHADIYFLARIKAQLNSRRAFQMSWRKRMLQLGFSVAIISGLLIGVGLGIQLKQMQNEQLGDNRAQGTRDSYIDTSVFETMPAHSLTETYVQLSSHNE